MIREKERGLYKLNGQLEQVLIHDSVEPSELWHRRLAHVHYMALPLASKAVEGLPEIQAKHDGVCKGCVKGKNTKKTFPSSEIKAKGILEIIHSDVCRPMSSSSLSSFQQVQGIQSLDQEPHRKEDQDLSIRQWWRIHIK